MHFHKNATAAVKKIFSSLLSLMPYVFIILVIFSFDEAEIAVLTLLSALFHEAGHVVAMTVIGRDFSLKGVLSGLRLKPKRLLSYTEEIAVAIAGPCVNLLLFAVFIFSNEAFLSGFAILNLFTALTNLLPIAGYDGYRIANAILAKCTSGTKAQSILGALSFCTVTALAFLSLYFISRFNSGYWTFFVFIFFMLREIKNDRRVFFARKKEISRDFKRFQEL